MPIYQQEPQHATSKVKPATQQRSIVWGAQLSSSCAATPRGLRVEITAAPHHRIPDRTFYEMWIYWEGGTLRVSSVFHDEKMRSVVLDLVADLTNTDHQETLTPVFEEYDWRSEG